VIEAWRLLKRRLLKHAFDGEGARLYGGRWNSPGVPVIYCSATASLAVLEVFANVQRGELAQEYVLISCSFSADLMEKVSLHALPRDWRRSPAPGELQALGDQWIREARSLVLQVPSAIIEHEYNYLINPRHAGFRRLNRRKPERFTFDLRLLQKP
jgi:RES domain-containing protein